MFVFLPSTSLLIGLSWPWCSEQANVIEHFASVLRAESKQPGVQNARSQAVPRREHSSPCHWLSHWKAEGSSLCSWTESCLKDGLLKFRAWQREIILQLWGRQIRRKYLRGSGFNFNWGSPRPEGLLLSLKTNKTQTLQSRSLLRSCKLFKTCPFIMIYSHWEDALPFQSHFCRWLPNELLTGIYIKSLYRLLNDGRSSWFKWVIV